jgi:hypothetical protein
MTSRMYYPVMTALCSALLLTGCGSAKTVTNSKKVTGPTVRLTLAPVTQPTPGHDTLVYAKLTHNDGLYVLNDNDLQTVHTKKFHLLVIDPTLTDYQHIHPATTSTPGLYSFHFTPKLAGGYRAWADITPVETNTQEFVWQDLGNPDGININKTPSSEALTGGYRFSLSFDTPPVSGQTSTGTITITGTGGTPVTSLEPVMGAYGHIVGFYDDFRTIVHTHPMGAEPQNVSDRGGPKLTFHIEPEKDGFIKLFAQVKINGKELFAPFGVVVNKP